MKDQKVTIESIQKRIIAAKQSAEQKQHNPPPLEESDYKWKLLSELSQANRTWLVDADYEITSHRPRIGRFIVFGKKVVRKLLRWYVSAAFNKQRTFNADATRSLNAAYEYISLLDSQIQQIKCEQDTKISALSTQIQLIKSERTEDISAMTVRIQKIEEQAEKEAVNEEKRRQKIEENRINYLKFEDNFRGTGDAISARQQQYVPYFKNKQNVLDIGCGRGEFIELLLSEGIPTSGIDLDSDMVKHCQSKGYKVSKVDALEYLNGVQENTYDGIFMAQVIEHMAYDEYVPLLRQMFRVLKPGGVVIVETIYAQTVVAVSNAYYLDPTHKNLVHPELLRFIMKEIGFSSVERKDTSPVEHIKLPELKANGAESEELHQYLEHVHWVLFGNRDYAIIGVK